MLKKFKSISSKIESLVEELQDLEIEGPVPILEEAKELVESAIDEYKYYHSEEDVDGD